MISKDIEKMEFANKSINFILCNHPFGHFYRFYNIFKINYLCYNKTVIIFIYLKK